MSIQHLYEYVALLASPIACMTKELVVFFYPFVYVYYATKN